MAAETCEDDHPGFRGNVKQEIRRVRHDGASSLAVKDGKGERLIFESLDDPVHVEKEP